MQSLTEKLSTEALAKLREAATILLPTEMLRRLQIPRRDLYLALAGEPIDGMTAHRIGQRLRAFDADITQARAAKIAEDEREHAEDVARSMIRKAAQNARVREALVRLGAPQDLHP